MVNSIKIMIRGWFGQKSEVDRLVSYSVKEYGKTYKMLEQYDKKNISDAKILAGSGRLQKYIRKIQTAN